MSSIRDCTTQESIVTFLERHPDVSLSPNNRCFITKTTAETLETMQWVSKYCNLLKIRTRKDHELEIKRGEEYPNVASLVNDCFFHSFTTNQMILVRGTYTDIIMDHFRALGRLSKKVHRFETYYPAADHILTSLNINRMVELEIHHRRISGGRIHIHGVKWALDEKLTIFGDSSLSAHFSLMEIDLDEVKQFLEGLMILKRFVFVDGPKSTQIKNFADVEQAALKLKLSSEALETALTSLTLIKNNEASCEILTATESQMRLPYLCDRMFETFCRFIIHKINRKMHLKRFDSSIHVIPVNELENFCTDLSGLVNNYLHEWLILCESQVLCLPSEKKVQNVVELLGAEKKGLLYAVNVLEQNVSSTHKILAMIKQMHELKSSMFQQLDETKIQVKHSEGVVEYDCKNYILQNCCWITDNVVALFSESQNQMAKDAFERVFQKGKFVLASYVDELHDYLNNLQGSEVRIVYSIQNMEQVKKLDLVSVFQAFRANTAKIDVAALISKDRIDQLNQQGYIAGKDYTETKDKFLVPFRVFQCLEIINKKKTEYSDTESLADSEPEIIKQKPVEVIKKTQTAARKMWLLFTWIMTFWMSEWFLKRWLKLNRDDIRIAWREKLCICTCIMWICAIQLFVIIGLGRVICPPQQILNSEELFYRNSFSKPISAVYGAVYDLLDFVQLGTFHPLDLLAQFGGLDVTPGFPRVPASYCSYAKSDFPAFFDLATTVMNGTTLQLYHKQVYDKGVRDAEEAFDSRLKKKWTHYLGYEPNEVKSLCNGTLQSPGVMFIMNERVYNVKPYIAAMAQGKKPDFFPAGLLDYIKTNAGKDLSSDQYMMNFWKDPEIRLCFNNLMLLGFVDYRKSARCVVSNYVLLGFSCLLFTVIFAKFFAALQLGRRKEPEEHLKYVILQVPCYTEDEISLRKAINSLCALSYSDKHKLLFIVCDGNIVGRGNDRPTYRIALDILQVHDDEQPLSFQSLGDGNLQHNMAKLYSGFYLFEGHKVPFLLVAKVGCPEEMKRPGNRGKRDSQMILMRFLNKVYTNSPMSPLELEMCFRLKHQIKVDPREYEFCLMIDADTEVAKSSLTHLISVMANDKNVMGCCGETQLSNEKDTWATMIQVYEYYISHYMAKAFESLFGSVTCLPGCFCMYRIRHSAKNTPLLVSNMIIDDYGICNVDTLHKKNLLHLGEDRYLTTLMLKNFSDMRTVFCGEAKCFTVAPENWNVLLSQRRRWINSTVHNLFELLNISALCGFCCFSMRFVVFIDLLATFVQPAICVYLGYLLYLVITYDPSNSQFPLLSLILLASIYGVQAIIFLIKREWQHIGWMIIYLVSIPIFSFFIPVYSFWHMDDFSWGNTRVVVGEKGMEHVVLPSEVKFDLSLIPHRSFSDFEQEKLSLMNESNQMERIPYSADVPVPIMTVLTSPQLSPDIPLSVHRKTNDIEMMDKIKSILQKSDLTTITKRKVRQMLQEDLGYEPPKEKIDKMIMSALDSMN